MSDSLEQTNTQPAASTAAGGVAQPGQPESQAPVAQPAADPFEQVFTWDNVPRAAWEYVQKGVQSGEVPKEVVDSWVTGATERQRRQVHDYRERGQLLRTIRELAGKGPEQQPATPPAPPAPVPMPSLKQELAGVDALDETAVEALERVLDKRDERLKAEVLGHVSQVAPQQATQADPKAVVLAQETRQGARLGERFSVLKEQDKGWLLEEIKDEAKFLSANARYRAASTPDEFFDRLYDDASTLVMSRYPQLRSSPAVNPPAAPTPTPKVPPQKNGITPATRPAAQPELSYRDRQVLAANLRSRGHSESDARRAAGLPPL